MNVKLRNVKADQWLFLLNTAKDLEMSLGEKSQQMEAFEPIDTFLFI